MYCNQCEQTLHGTACAKAGVCGKQPETAALQYLIVYALRGLALVALEARAKGVIIAEADRLCVQALFATVTNVNFDHKSLLALLQRVVQVRKELARKAGAASSLPVALFEPAFLACLMSVSATMLSAPSRSRWPWRKPFPVP